MSPVDTEVTSVPKFSDEAHNLAKIASNLGKDGLISVMKISEKLADLNLQRFKSLELKIKKLLCLLSLVTRIKDLMLQR